MAAKDSTPPSLVQERKNYLSLPIEVRKLISDNLDQYEDVQNLCIADNALKIYLKKLTLTTRVFRILLDQRSDRIRLNQHDALTCRQVCKLWNRCVDFNIKMFNQEYHADNTIVPKVRLSVPLTEKSAEQLRKFAEHPTFKICGNTLILMLQHGIGIAPELAYELVDHVPKKIWNQVEYLWVIANGYSVSGQAANLFMKILKKLLNVKELVLSCNTAGISISLLQALPNLNKLDALKVNGYRGGDMEIAPLLSKCSDSLKHLSVFVEHSVDLECCIYDLTFPKLESLLIPERSFILQHGNLDNLKMLSVDLEWNDSGQQLVATTNLCKSLQNLSIRRIKNHPHMVTTREFLPIFLTGNPSVSNLQVTSEDIPYVLNVAQLFPSAQKLAVRFDIPRSVKINKTLGKFCEIPISLEYEDVILWNALPKLCHVDFISCYTFNDETQSFSRSDFERNCV